MHCYTPQTAGFWEEKEGDDSWYNMYNDTYGTLEIELLNDDDDDDDDDDEYA
jgi:hypothetical protein